MSDNNHSIESDFVDSKCNHDHVCLSKTDYVGCDVEYCVNDKVLFVKPKKEGFACTYLNSFGFSHFCTCPNRMLVYQKTKK